MFTDNYTRRAIVKRIVDGDTMDVLVDCGFRRFSYERLRLNRINTPEIRGEERTDKQIEFQDTLDRVTQEYIDALISTVNDYGIERDEQEHDMHILNEIRETAFDMLDLPDVY